MEVFSKFKSTHVLPSLKFHRPCPQKFARNPSQTNEICYLSRFHINPRRFMSHRRHNSSEMISKKEFRSTLTATNGKHLRRCSHANGIANLDNKSTAHLLGCRVMELFVLFQLISIFMFVRARDLCLVSVFVWRKLVFRN